MGRRQNFKIDEAALLKTYRISTLSPTTWEDIDHDLTDSVAGALTGASGTRGDPENDPLGLGGAVDVSSLDMESKAAILISSKTFDPKVFLTAVHPNATYHDLASGIAHLKRSIESRAEAIRVLVEGNFDRFVAVKASTEALYAEMHDGLLADGTEFATKTLREQLKLCAAKADQVFLPVLESAGKAQNLRATLAVFERSRFFFNLPGSLMESIEAGKYEIALRDYRKGKFLFESRPGQLLPIDVANIATSSAAAQASTSSGSSASSLAETQQKRILDKVWGTVEKVMGEMKNVLLAQLKEYNRTVEEHEKTIEILLDLNTADDPVWVYFDSQHQHIMDLLNKAYESSLRRVEEIKVASSVEAIDDIALNTLLATQLQNGIQSLKAKEAEVIIDDAACQESWEAVVDLVKKVSNIILTSLPQFWKIAKRYVDGKFKKGTSNSSRRSPNQCRIMAAEIVKLYISHISAFFTLSDMAVTSPPDRPGSTSPIPPFVPPTSSSLIASHYLTTLLAEIQECVTETLALDISNDAASSLRSLLESTRWRFEDALSAVWMRDANIFFSLETWTSNPSEPTTTLYLTQLQAFQNHLTVTAFKIAGGIGSKAPAAPSSLRPGKQDRIPVEFASKITKSFLDSLYAFLDGMVHLASEDAIVKRPSTSQTNTRPARSVPGHMDLVDLTNPDTRLLIVVSNFGHFMQSILPNMIGQLENAFGINVDADRQTLETVVQELDRTLFEGYIKPKATAVLAIVRSGVLDPNMDWYETPRPTEIRPYMYETLMYLVQVHAHVSRVAKPLVDRTLNALVEEIAEEALRCFRQVKRFGMGGMLRATLEIEFMHQTLSRYVTPTAARTLSDVYNKISQAYQRRSGDESLQNHLDNVKKTLAETRRATGIEFLCFRGSSSGKVPEKDKGGAVRPSRSVTPSIKDGHDSSESVSTGTIGRSREKDPRRRAISSTHRGD